MSTPVSMQQAREHALRVLRDANEERHNEWQQEIAMSDPTGMTDQPSPGQRALVLEVARLNSKVQELSATVHATEARLIEISRMIEERSQHSGTA